MTRPALPPATVRYFVGGWRMSPITSGRPDPNQQIAEQDMNTWERIDPGRPQRQWESQAGYAIYRAMAKPPKIVQARGGEILFHGLAGAAEVFIDGQLRASMSATESGTLVVPVGASMPSATISVLLRADRPPAGLTGRVEIVAK